MFVAFSTRMLWIFSILVILHIRYAAAIPVWHPSDLQHQARDVNPTVLKQVLQLDVPTLTVDGQGELEVTDGLETLKVIQAGLPPCQQLLMTHSFSNSYGSPYVGSHVPPSCSFNRVTWNLTVTSNGTQYDRLGTVWLGDIEVLRTSTAEPGGGAIRWSYLKDMTPYLSLLKQDQKIIFDLGNTITATNTASYNTILTATYYTDANTIAPADLIVPISKRLSSQGLPSTFSAPGDNATNSVFLPQNIRKAIFTIAATGQDTEEFWWSNVPSSDVNALPDYGELYGHSPFREVQLLIDGSLAGVSWPFPVVFTGAVIAGLWSPVVGIDVFDLKETEIDITPWLPLLCDGKLHQFSLLVTGLVDNDGTVELSGTVGSNWLLSGKLFVWYDEEGHVTTGTRPQITGQALNAQVTTTSPGGTGNSAKLYYQVHAHRELEVTSTLKTSNGSQSLFWRQTLDFSNVGNYTEAGKIEVVQQQTTGIDRSSTGYARQISYPFYAYTGYASTSRGLTISGTINRGKDISTVGEAIFLENEVDVIDSYQRGAMGQGSALNTYQNASGKYISDVRARTSTTSATTDQVLSLASLQVYDGNSSSRGFPPTRSVSVLNRHVQAVNGSIVAEIKGASRFTKSIPAVQLNFEPPRLPGRGHKGRHISELAPNITLSPSSKFM